MIWARPLISHHPCIFGKSGTVSWLSEPISSSHIILSLRMWCYYLSCHGIPLTCAQDWVIPRAKPWLIQYNALWRHCITTTSFLHDVILSLLTSRHFLFFSSPAHVISLLPLSPVLFLFSHFPAASPPPNKTVRTFWAAGFGGRIFLLALLLPKSVPIS